MSAVTVTVVVPYFQAQAGLDLLLTALELQSHPLPLMEVVVADDGSATPPVLGRRPYRVSCVRQPDLGIRPAAARNLGARAGTGEVLVFLDGDTLPEPGFVAAMVRAVAGRRVLAVGRRRHADLAGWTPEGVRAWLGGSPGAAAPTELPEPAWLAEAYARTDDLRTAGDDAYRFVIAAVLALPRQLLDEVGGWEDDIVCYGGEDWELAHRCWLAGADLRHVPDAVGWHDGPDFGGREVDRLALKNVESAVLAPFLTDPAARQHGLVYPFPGVVVRLDDTGCAPADVTVAVASWLQGTDAGLWLREGAAAAPRGPLALDPRVHVGPVPPEVLARCRHQVDVVGALELVGGTLAHLCTLGAVDLAPVGGGTAVTVRRTRDLARGDRPVPAAPAAEVRPLSGTRLESAWSVRARVGPLPGAS